MDNENSDDEEAFFIQAIRPPASQPALVTCTVNDPHKSKEAQQVVAGLIVSIERRWLGYEEEDLQHMYPEI